MFRYVNIFDIYTYVKFRLKYPVAKSIKFSNLYREGFKRPCSFEIKYVNIYIFYFFFFHKDSLVAVPF